MIVVIAYTVENKKGEVVSMGSKAISARNNGDIAMEVDNIKSLFIDPLKVKAGVFQVIEPELVKNDPDYEVKT